MFSAPSLCLGVAGFVCLHTISLPGSSFPFFTLLTQVTGDSERERQAAQGMQISGRALASAKADCLSLCPGSLAILHCTHSSGLAWVTPSDWTCCDERLDAPHVLGLQRALSLSLPQTLSLFSCKTVHLLCCRWPPLVSHNDCESGYGREFEKRRERRANFGGKNSRRGNQKDCRMNIRCSLPLFKRTPLSPAPLALSFIIQRCIP